MMKKIILPSIYSLILLASHPSAQATVVSALNNYGQYVAGATIMAAENDLSAYPDSQGIYGNWSSRAQSFTTGANAAQLAYVSFMNHRQRVTLSAYGLPMTLIIYADNGAGAPPDPFNNTSTPVYTFSGSPTDAGSLAINQIVVEEHTYNVSDGDIVTLDANTTYWAVFQLPVAAHASGANPDALYEASATLMDGETSDYGWTLGDNAYVYLNNFPFTPASNGYQWRESASNQPVYDENGKIMYGDDGYMLIERVGPAVIMDFGIETVPEPSSTLLLLSGVFLLFSRRRRS